MKLAIGTIVFILLSGVTPTILQQEAIQSVQDVSPPSVTVGPQAVYHPLGQSISEDELIAASQVQFDDPSLPITVKVIQSDYDVYAEGLYRINVEASDAVGNSLVLWFDLKVYIPMSATNAIKSVSEARNATGSDLVTWMSAKELFISAGHILVETDATYQDSVPSDSGIYGITFNHSNGLYQLTSTLVLYDDTSTITNQHAILANDFNVSLQMLNSSFDLATAAEVLVLDISDPNDFFLLENPVIDSVISQLGQSLTLDDLSAGTYDVTFSYLDSAKAVVSMSVMDNPPIHTVNFYNCGEQLIAQDWVGDGEDALPPKGYSYPSVSYQGVYRNLDANPTNCESSFSIVDTGN
ncbi:MAG: hypothetical protein ACK5LZ_05260 [Anaerorhabdus sp.]